MTGGKEMWPIVRTVIRLGMSRREIHSQFVTGALMNLPNRLLLYVFV